MIQCKNQNGNLSMLNPVFWPQHHLLYHIRPGSVNCLDPVPCCIDKDAYSICGKRADVPRHTLSPLNSLQGSSLEVQWALRKPRARQPLHFLVDILLQGPTINRVRILHTVTFLCKLLWPSCCIGNPLLFLHLIIWFSLPYTQMYTSEHTYFLSGK